MAICPASGEFYGISASLPVSTYAFVSQATDHGIFKFAKMKRAHPERKGDAVTIFAIWFGIAVVMGGLLGCAARRLKNPPNGQPPIRKASNSNAEDSEGELNRASNQSSIKTNTLP
jgi:hypothetical protein